MFSELPTPAPDAILGLMQAYREDPRADKLDLGVGVYKDASGQTPIMRAVKKAEQDLWHSESTKTYTGLAGDPAFAAALGALLLGGCVDIARVAAVATPGGTGAYRQALELVRRLRPGARIWMSSPTWPNHVSIAGYLDLEVARYRYFDPASCDVDLQGMLADLDGLSGGDVVLLHGCCHNPTGANLDAAGWTAVAGLLAARGALAIVDIAYQGFGDGLEADAAGLRTIAAALPETLIVASCSKNFGIYRERTGLIMAIAAAPQGQPALQATLAFLNRQNYSFPPDHGARLVTMILADPDRRADWEAELEEMRLGMLALRRQLADELRQRTNSDRFDFIARHRGMFSLLGLSQAQVARLRAEHGIYMVSDSRINIAGLNRDTVPMLAAAIAAVCGTSD